MRLLASVVVFNIFLILFISEVTQTSSQYTAAVVEYYPIQDVDLPPDQRLLKNVQNYVNILSQVQQKIDIVVFPESTLTQHAVVKSLEDVTPYAVEIQDEPDGTSLCNPEVTSTFLYYLACATRNFNNYLVINLIERARCKANKKTNCSADGWNFYNTDVVFDRSRAVVAKYRKYNLFGEYYMTQTATPDITTFKTDFGVTFGIFTCFDILFRSPALELVKKHGITNIIYPTMWFSELPFLTALQAQQQWAQETNAVLLASGANNPKVGSGGTGIFNGTQGPIIYDMLAKEGSNIYIATVPKQIGTDFQPKANTGNIDELAKKLDGFYFKKDDLKSYASIPIAVSQKQIKETLCSGDDSSKICCHFDIAMNWDAKILQDNKNHYQYHLVAYSGVRSFSGVYNGGVEICGLVACTRESMDSCGERLGNYNSISWPATFTKVSIKANFTVDENRIQFPNSLLSSIRPIPVDATEWKQQYFENNAIIERTHVLTKPQNRLMTFAIYGRDFNRDSAPKEDDKDGGSGYVRPGFYIFILTLMKIFI